MGVAQSRRGGQYSGERELASGEREGLKSGVRLHELQAILER